MESEKHISDRDTLERLARLETKTCLKFEEMEKALVLARDLVRNEKENARISIESKMEHMNQLQRKMDKQELTFATKDDLLAGIASLREERAIVVDSLKADIQRLEKQIIATNKLVYIGVGLAIAFELFMKLFPSFLTVIK